jgi:peroxiredoxin
MRTMFVLILSLLPAGLSHAATPPAAGEAAPGFTLQDANGRSHSLSEYKGSYVVLEWVNFGCPFVRKHYASGNIPALQKEYTAKKVVWLSICSSAPGKQGFFEKEELKKQIAAMKAAPTAYLLDPEGTVGKLYAAKTTPTMFVIDRKGIILYGGAIDNIPSTDPDDIAKARNYVKEALDHAMAGKAIEVTSSKSYGCSVKYKE